MSIRPENCKDIRKVWKEGIDNSIHDFSEHLLRLEMSINGIDVSQLEADATVLKGRIDYIGDQQAVQDTAIMVLNEEKAGLDYTEAVYLKRSEAEFLRGPPGKDGKDGKDGLNGEPGRDGKDGLNGEPGRDGKDGLNGEPGRDGKDGLNGEPGRDGKDGLNGEPGRDGKDGERGPQGPPGIIENVTYESIQGLPEMLDTLDSSISTHASNKDNPHAVTKAQIGLSNVNNTSDLAKPISTATQTALDEKADITYVDMEIANIPEVDISGKQDKLTFDNTPVAGSDNPVKSGGIYDALSTIQDKLTFDNAPVSGSDNPVKSGGIYDVLQGLVERIDMLTPVEEVPRVNCTTLLTMYKGDTTLTETPVINAALCTSLREVFEGCTNLKTVKYIYAPNVTNMSGMFRDCSSLTTLPMLDTRNVSNTQAMFFGCSSLTSVPALDMSKVTSNTVQMFSGCSSLTSVTFTGNVVPPYGNYTFRYTPIEAGNGYIFVPDNMVNAYKTKTGWSVHASVIKALSEKEGLQSNINMYNMQIKENPTMFAMTEEEKLETMRDMEEEEQ